MEEIKCKFCGKSIQLKGKEEKAKKESLICVSQYQCFHCGAKMILSIQWTK